LTDPGGQLALGGQHPRGQLTLEINFLVVNLSWTWWEIQSCRSSPITQDYVFCLSILLIPISPS